MSFDPVAYAMGKAGMTRSVLSALMAGDGGGGGYNTFTGSVVRFLTTASSPIRSIIASIAPVQSGSGDPSPDNIRPISGWSAVNVWRTGKNLLSPHLYKGISYNPAVGTTVTITDSQKQFTDNGDGSFSITLSESWSQYTLLIPINARMPRIHLSYEFASTANGGHSRGYLSKDYKILSQSSSNSATVTYDGNWNPSLNPDAAYIFLVITNRGSETATLTLTKPQAEFGNVTTTYHPYSGNQYTLQLGDTYYGGTLDVTNGVLTVDRAMVDLGTLEWTSQSSSEQQSYYSPPIDNIVKPLSDMSLCGAICSQYTQVVSSTFIRRGDKTFCISGSSRININDNSYSDAYAFKTAMSGVQLVYELVTPITIPLTPTEISTLAGTNVMWADTGDIEVTARGTEIPADDN